MPEVFVSVPYHRLWNMSKLFKIYVNSHIIFKRSQVARNRAPKKMLWKCSIVEKYSWATTSWCWKYILMLWKCALELWNNLVLWFFSLARRIFRTNSKKTLNKTKCVLFFIRGSQCNALCYCYRQGYLCHFLIILLFFYFILLSTHE